MKKILSEYKLIMISTFINDIHIYKLINSLSSCNFPIRLVLVNQTKYIVAPSFCNENVTIDEIKIGHNISLSKARNIALDYIIENNIEGNYIMFPDDDNSFDSSFFKNFNKTTLLYANTNIVIKVYDEGTKKLHLKNMQEGAFLQKTNYRHATCWNMILKFDIMKQVGFFDERMGVGAKYGAGEDNDYFIRVKKISNLIYTNELHIYHPPLSLKYDISVRKLINRYKNYGNGVIFMLLKHNLHFDAIMLCFRAMAGCLKYLLKADIKMSYVYFLSFFYRISMLVNLYVSKEYKIEKHDHRLHRNPQN